VFNTDYKKYSNKKEFVSYGKFSADWETRNLFVSYSNQSFKTESVDNTFTQKTRFGIAPYIAKYGSLHTWLIYELHHMPGENNNLVSSLLVRLFKSTNLVEIGLDKNKNAILNYIKRF